MSAYTTLANLKAYLNIAGTGDDALLTRLITSASGFIDTVTARPNGLAVATYNDYRDGNGKTQMTMKNTPVQSVTSLVVDGNQIQPLPAPGVGVATPAFPCFSFDENCLYLTGAVFCQARQNVAMSYTAGFFTVGDGSNAAAVIEQACIDLVALKYKQRDRIGKTSEALTGIGTVAYLVRDLPADLKEALVPFTRVAYVTDY